MLPERIYPHGRLGTVLFQRILHALFISIDF